MPGEKNIKKDIDVTISKAIRPSVTGKKTLSRVEAYKSKTRDAIKTIYSNKENLGLIDASGQPVKKLPESLTDLSRAVENVRKITFKYRKWFIYTSRNTW